MENITTAFSSLPPIVQYLVVGVLLLYGGISAWQRFFSARSADITEAENRLVALLRENVGELEKKLAATESARKEDKKEFEQLHRENLKNIGRLEGENTTLKMVLQGRDGDTVKSRELVAQIAAAAEQTLGIVKGLAASQKGLEDNVSRFIDALGKHVVPAPQLDRTTLPDAKSDTIMG